MLTGYCAGWSLKQLIQEGLGGIPGKITSSPASHLSTLCNQMVNFLGIMQNEWAGAQAFSSFDTYLAPFVKVDNLTQKEVKQCIQSFAVSYTHLDVYKRQMWSSSLAGWTATSACWARWSWNGRRNSGPKRSSRNGWITVPFTVT